MEGGNERIPALDGLRGVAILAVIGFHGGIGVAGGALGVDLFLVLSGFLITSLLARELARSGRIDLTSFWGRRLRRLLPALLVVVAAVLVHAALGGEASPGGLRADALATLGYVANWHFALADGGYFASFGPPSPLRHTWSLAVEEQWYLLWPPVLWGLWRLLGRRPAALITSVLVAAVTSATLMARWAGDVDRVHYGTDTRAQGLLLGAAAALALHHRPAASWRPRSRQLLAGTGVVAMAVVIWLCLVADGNEPWLYRGGHLGFAAAAAVATVATQVPGPVQQALAYPVLRWFGLVSYGLYLWHWPVFVWLSPDRTGLDVWPLFALRCGVSIGLAALSARFVERPFRAPGRRVPRPGLLAGLATASIAVLALAVGGLPGSGTAVLTASAGPTVPVGYVSPSSAPASSAAPAEPEAVATRSAPAGAPLPAPAPRTSNGTLDVTVVGDSTGWSLAFELHEPPGMAVTDGGVLGCGIDPALIMIDDTPTVVPSAPVPCTEALNLWRLAVANSAPDLILLTLGAWEVFDRELPDGTRLRVGTDEWRDWFAAGLADVAAALAAEAGGATLVLPLVPCFDEQGLFLGGPGSPRNDPLRVAAVNDVITAFAAANPERVALVPMDDWLCPGGEPRETIDGVVLRPDGVHVLHAGAELTWHRMLGPALSDLVPDP